MAGGGRCTSFRWSHSSSTTTARRYPAVQRGPGVTRHAAALGADPPTDEEIDKLKERRDQLCAKWGRDFKHAYGWAADLLGTEGRQFVEIERAVQRNHLRPYHGMASHAVHPNARGSFFDLGLSPNANIILAGTSTSGLADPPLGSCGSLFDCTYQLLHEHFDLDEAVAIYTLDDRLGRTADALQAAHEEHERRASELRGAT